MRRASFSRARDLSSARCARIFAIRSPMGISSFVAGLAE